MLEEDSSDVGEALRLDAAAAELYRWLLKQSLQYTGRSPRG
jgi:hypothetical protein